MPNERRWASVQLSKEYARPAGAYSPAVVAGGMIFVSGQIPKNPVTGEVMRDGDIREQTRSVLDNVRLALEAAGGTLHDVVSVTVYLADSKDWGAFNEVYASVMSEPYPSRTAVGVQLRDILVEVSAIALAR